MKFKSFFAFSASEHIREAVNIDLTELSHEVTHDLWKVAIDSKTGIHILLTINEFSDSNSSNGIGHIESEVIEKYVRKYSY